VAKLTKEMLSLAGEYAVASELCRRGLYSQLTLGNHKRTDILVETETRMIRVSVKAKQGNEWPSISGPVRDDDFIVFVDFAGKVAGDNLDFFILGKDDWSEVVKKEVLNQKDKGKELKVDSGTVIWPDGWKGINVKILQIAGFKDKWETIVSAVNPIETEAV
jgi:hypothetical protein